MIRTPTPPVLTDVAVDEQGDLQDKAWFQYTLAGVIILGVLCIVGYALYPMA